MKDGPVIAAVAALLGGPALANMLTAMMDGRALTASDLAAVAGIAMPKPMATCPSSQQLCRDRH